MALRVKGWLDERLGLEPIARKVLDKPVPRHINWLHCFGGLTFFTFLVQAATGIILAFFYVPSPDHARDSIDWFQRSIPFGTIVRNLHRWGAYAMVVLVFLHMLRVLVHGAYRKPREMNWLLGVGLLMLVLGMGFTGYLLPWDQRAYWATSVGVNIVETVPLIGGPIARFLMGGPELGALTLLRFFAMHVFVLPLLIVGGMLAHFAMVRRQGIARPL